MDEIRGVVGEAVSAEAVLHAAIGAPKWTEVALLDGAPLAIFGLSVWPDGTGCPWLFATDLITRVRRRDFMYYTRHVMAQMCADAPAMANYVAANHHAAHRWLKWAGFTIDPKPVLLREGGIPFNIFYRLSDV